MNITKSLSNYIDFVDQKLSALGDPYPINRTAKSPELKFIRFCAESDVRPEMAANTICTSRRSGSFFHASQAQLEGALSVFYSQQ